MLDQISRRVLSVQNLDDNLRRLVNLLPLLRKNHKAKERLALSVVRFWNEKNTKRLRASVNQLSSLMQPDRLELRQIDSLVGQTTQIIQTLVNSELDVRKKERESATLHEILYLRRAVNLLLEAISLQVVAIQSFQNDGNDQSIGTLIRALRQEGDALDVDTKLLKEIETNAEALAKLGHQEKELAEMRELPLSIIIPAHNEEDCIDATLKSIAGQNYSNFEIIVVCDNCSDNTEFIAPQYARTVNIKKGSVAAARNAGAKISRGSVLVFNDADTTIIGNNYFNEINKAIKEGYVSGSPKLKSETNHPIGIISVWIFNYYSKFQNYFHGNGFVRKDIFINTGGYNENLTAGEDTDLAERLKSMGKFKYLSNTLLIYSMRRFAQKGYMREFMRHGYEGLTYFLARDKYYKQHTRNTGQD